MADFLMPALGADMEHGKVVEWLVKPGDFVHRGDLMAEVDTDKAVMEVESFEDGVVGELLVEVGMTVPVGAPLARIVQTPAVGAERVSAPHAPPAADRTAAPAPVSPPVRHLAQLLGVDTDTIRGTGRHGAVTRADVEKAAGAAAEAAEQRPAERRPAERRPAEQRPDVQSADRSGTARVPASPMARRVAAELGIQLAGIVGSGPRGAVTVDDVRRAGHEVRRAGTEEPAAQTGADVHVGAGAAGPAASSGTGRVEPAGGAERAAKLRRAIGTLMARSKQTIPHYYLGTTVDLTAARDWLTTVNADRPVSARLVPAVLLLKATARAAQAIPEVNGFYVDDEYRPSSAVHLGVAVALRRGGLVAPAIHDADTLTLDELSTTLRDLVLRARGGRLQRAEMADPTLTVTNLGDLGVESVFGVIYPPQVALVGFGRMRDEPYVREGMLGVRPVVSATLSADHRVSDGLRGGRFLELVDELLQSPETL